ncbi:hypothetical protein Tco_0528525 [Tanacetum coccineum]
MPTEMELTLEQTQQGVSYEVSVFTMKMEILLEPTSNKLMVAGNPVKKILLKLNLSDHRSILTDLKVTPTKPGRMTKPYSSPRFIANCFAIKVGGEFEDYYSDKIRSIIKEDTAYSGLKTKGPQRKEDQSPHLGKAIRGNEEDKRRGVEYVMSKILGFYNECLELGPEYLSGMEDEGEVTSVEEHLAPVVAVSAIDPIPSTEETEPFKTDESAATPPPPPTYRTTSRIAEMTLTRAELPPWKRLLLTAPTPRFEVEESYYFFCAARSEIYYGSLVFIDGRVRSSWTRYSGAQSMIMLALVDDVNTLRRYLSSLCTTHEQERVEARQALDRSKAYIRALEARIAILETQSYRHEWQRQDADDCATGRIMRIQELVAGASIDTLEDIASCAIDLLFVIS